MSSGAADDRSGLAAAALEQFNQKLYDEAYESLQSLQKMLPKPDPKINHNLALLLYLRERELEPEKFLEALREIQAQLESKEESESPETEEDFDIDKSVVIYNRAVIYFQMKQFSTACQLLESLFEHIEPIQERLALCICVLLLECHLAVGNCTRAEAVLQFLEKTATENAPRPPGAALTVAGAAGPSAAAAAPVAGAPAPATSNGPNRKKSATDEDKDSDGKAEGDAVPLPSVEGDFGGVISYADMLSLVHQYRGRVQLEKQSVKTAKREIKSAMSLPEPPITALFLKANLEYMRHNYRKAQTLLNSVPMSALEPATSHGTTGDLIHENRHTLPTIFWNDLGVVHHRMGKHHLAQLYFTKALQQNKTTTSPDGPVSLPEFSSDKRYEVLYNTGVELLYTGKPLVAYRALRECAKLYYQDPRVWLRIAECCIAAHCSRVQERARAMKSDVAMRLVGSGPKRRVLLPTADLDAEVESGLPDYNGDSGPSLRYAAKCLRNALALVCTREREEDAAASDKGAERRAGTPGELELKHAIMIKRSYVALTLQNPVLALAVAEDLLQDQDCPPTYAFLAHMYAAEALCILRRPAEATTHLSPTILSQLPGPTGAYKPPYSALTYSDNVDLLTAAQTAFWVNLAGTFIMQENLADAQQVMRQVLSIAPGAPPVVLLSAYLHLRDGKTALALDVLKKHRAPMFVGS